MPFDFGEDFQLRTEKKVGSATLGDVALQGVASAVDLANNAVLTGQYAAGRAGMPNASRILRGIGRLGAAASDTIQDRVTDGGKGAANAALIPTGDQQSLTDAPLSSLAMKGVGAIPSVAATIMAGVLGGIPGAAGAGAGLQTMQVTGRAMRDINSLTDAGLKEKYPAYKRLREEDGLDVEAARDALAGLLVTGQDLGLNAIAGAVGALPISRAWSGASAMGTGRLGAAAGAGIEGLGGGVVGGVADDYTKQTGDVRTGVRPDISLPELAIAGVNAGFESMVLGAGMGAAVGNPRAKDNTKAPPDTKGQSKIEKVDAKAPDAATTQALTGKATEEIDVEAKPQAKRGKRAKEAPPAEAPPATTEATKPPVTEPGNEAPPAGETPKVEDAGLTVPEKPVTFKEQIAQLVAGDRAAVLIPKGAKGRPTQPEGMKKVTTKEGTFYYDPERIKPKDIYLAIKEDRLNEILELGPVSKAEAMARQEQGEAPVAVTERTPDGTEVKAAAGTEETAPRQVNALEGSKTEGNTVQVEPVEQVLTDRAAPESALTPAEAPIAEAPQAEAPKAPEPPPAPEPPVTPPVTPSEAPTPAAKVAAVKEKAKAKAKKEPKLTEEQKAQSDFEENYAGLTDEQRAQVEQKVEAFRENAAKLGLTGAKLDAAVARQRGVEAEALLPKDDAEPEATRKSGPRTGEAKPSKDLKRNQARRDTNKSADEVVDGFKPGEDEKALGSGGGKGMVAMAALQRRLTAMLQAAEAAGIKLPERLKANADPALTPSPGVTLLVEARDLLRAAKKRGGVSNDHIADFTRTEWDLRQDGEAARDRVLEKRREEGDLRKKQTTDAAETAAPKEGAEPTEIDAASEVAANTKASDTENLDRAATDAGNKMGRDKERATTEGFNDSDSGNDIATPLEAARTEDILAKQQRLREEALEEAKNAKEQAAFKKKRAEEETRLDAIDAETEARIAKAKTARPSRMEPLSPEQIAEARAKLLAGRKAQGDKPSLLNDLVDVTTGERARPKQSMNAKEALAKLALENMPGVSGALARAIRSAYMRVLPDGVKVHILEDAEYARMVGEEGKDSTGAYVPQAINLEPTILLRASRVADDARYQHALLHEVTHAVMDRVLQMDGAVAKKLRTGLERIAGQVETWLQKYGTDEDRQVLEYALRRGKDGKINLREFTAETFSKGEAQDILRRIEADKITLGLIGHGRSRVGSFFDAVKELIRGTLEAVGLPKKAVSMMEASLTVGDDIIKLGRTDGDATRATDARISFLDDDGKPTVARAAEAMARQASDTGTNLTSLGKKVINKVRSLDNMARAADRIFGGADNNPIRKIQETVETIRVAAQKNLEASEPLIKKMDQLQRKHMASGQWELFTELQHDANMLNVHPDVDLKDARNKHVGTGIRDVQSRLGHADLAGRFAKLDPELQGLWREATSYYAGQQNTLAQKLLTNHLMKALVKKGAQEREAIAQRFFDGKETNADIKEIGQNAYDALKDVNELRRLKGPYFPQMRRGDFVVTAEVTVAPPKDGKVVGQDAYAFDETRLAADFARDVWKKHGLKATVRTEYYDPETGKTYFTDADGAQVKASKLEPDAAKRFVVDVPTRYVSFHETMAEAQRHAADLSGQDGFAKADASPRRFEQSGRSVDLLSSQMRALMARVEGGKAYKELTDAEKDAFKQALDVMSLQMLGSTRVQSRRMPRNFIQGASRDVTRNTLDYAQSMAAHLAKLDHQPTIDEALIKARDMARDGSRNADRTEILNEVEQRLAAPEYVASNTSPAVNRILQMSFLDKLFSPAYNLINMTQPIMNTVPLLAARHGWGATTGAMTRAYSIIGGGKNLAMGAANTVRAAKGKDTTDILTSMRDRLGKAGEQYVRLFDYLEGKGAIGSDAGLEVAKSIRRADGVMGKVDAGLNYADAIARALPEAIETNNRMASAVAAFDLELKKGAGEDAAMRKALDVVNQTQFNYSATNAPTFMKHPLAKVFFQFKKYAQGQYQFLGEQIATALKDADPAARKEAAKVLMNHALMVTAFAGVVGLPTEPIKALLLATAPVTGFSMTDFEREIEKLMPEVLSRGLSRGIPGGFAFDLSGRMGENSMLTFGTPKSYKSDDVKAWLFDNLKGAPAGLVEDWISGVNGLLTGDSSKQVESVGKLIPIKMFSDTLDAYRKATEGKTNARGQEKMAPYSPQEAMVRAIGFTPAREANTRAAQSYFYDKSRGLKDERSELTNAYLKGKTGDERTKAWAKIAKWNATQPAESRITREQLTKQEKSDRKAEQSGKLINGVRVTKQNERFLSEGNQLYGVR